MNTQPIEKRVAHNGTTLQVHSVFNTIQGEGPFAGHPAVFIRLAGCNLQCPACDTDYSSELWKSTPLALLGMVREMRNSPSLVVITGGEPFRQDLYPLVLTLTNAGYTVQVETNGSLPPPSPKFAKLCSKNLNDRKRCFIVCSPKTGNINSQIAPLVCAFKYVMGHDSVAEDGLPILALGHSAHPYVSRPGKGFSGAVYLQPRDDNDEASNEKNLRACVNSVMANGYILQLQIHKIIGME